jgi:ABC-type branched-subunit amino acid transport system ATPase component
MPNRFEAIEVYKSFAGVRALNGVSFSLNGDEVVGVLGPNGSGKTTLVNCLSGVLPPTSGRILHEGRDITRMPRDRRARQGLIRTFQGLRLFNGLTVSENIELGLSASPEHYSSQWREEVRSALEAQDLLSVSGQRVSELPYGAQRRTEIARALIARPQILLLDEPGAGLGNEECEILANSLRRARQAYGCAMFLIDHNVPFVASLADRMILLAGGKVILEGTPTEVLADPIVGDIYLGKAKHA